MKDQRKIAQDLYDRQTVSKAPRRHQMAGDGTERRVDLARREGEIREIASILASMDHECQNVEEKLMEAGCLLLIRHVLNPDPCKHCGRVQNHDNTWLRTGNVTCICKRRDQ